MEESDGGGKGTDCAGGYADCLRDGSAGEEGEDSGGEGGGAHVDRRCGVCVRDRAYRCNQFVDMWFESGRRLETETWCKDAEVSAKKQQGQTEA